MIMDRENGREIVHIKNRYNVDGVMKRFEQVHVVDKTKTITELSMTIKINKMMSFIGVWRDACDKGYYNLDVGIYDHLFLFKTYRTFECVSKDDLDAAIEAAIHCIVELSKAVEERQVLSEF